MFVILFNVLNAEFLLANVPDSIELLLFGVVMIFSATGLRRILSRNDKSQANENFQRKTENYKTEN